MITLQPDFSAEDKKLKVLYNAANYRNHFNKLLRKRQPIPHRMIFELILERTVRIDFLSKAELTGDQRITNAHYQILVVEELHTMARMINLGLCRKNENIYLYNGAFWRMIDVEDVMDFLRDIGVKMGVPKFKVNRFLFREQQFKQFSASSNIRTGYKSKEVIVNLSDGTYMIENDGSIKKGDFKAEDFLTHQLPFGYDPNADCSQFQTYIDRVLPDRKCQDVIFEYFGYLFIPSSRLKLEKALLLYGQGANGKSVFYDIVKAMLGSENISNYSLRSLTNESGYQRAVVRDKLANYASELGNKHEVSLLKQLISGESTEARHPYGRPFTIDDFAKLIFNCNELPWDVEHTNAYFRRLIIVPFTVTIPEEEQDKDLATKIIQSELPGIFNLVLAGLQRILQNKKFTESASIAAAVKEYQETSDSVKLFLSEKELVPSAEDWRLLKDLYSDYRVFCVEDGYKPVNKMNFRKRLERIPINIIRRGEGNVVFVENEIRIILN